MNLYFCVRLQVSLLRSRSEVAKFLTMCAMYLSVLSSATAADRQQIGSVSFSSAAIMLDFKKIMFVAVL